VNFIDYVNGKWYEIYAYSAFYYWIYKWSLNNDSNIIFDANHKVTRWEMAIYLSKALALFNH